MADEGIFLHRVWSDGWLFTLCSVGWLGMGHVILVPRLGAYIKACHVLCCLVPLAISFSSRQSTPASSRFAPLEWKGFRVLLLDPHSGRCERRVHFFPAAIVTRSK